MTIPFNDHVILSCFHNGKTPYLKISTGTRSNVTRLDDAAALAGVSRQTLARWCDGTQRPALAALRLFQVAYLGLMPWPEWAPFRMAHGRDQDNRQRWLITHDQVAQHWTPERVLMIGYGYDAAAELRRQRDLLQATVTALSTRQPPPLPCAEIIPLSHFQQAKKSPA